MFIEDTFRVDIMDRNEFKFRKLLDIHDSDFASYLSRFDYDLLNIDGLTKINSFKFRKDYWSKPMEQVTINPNANVGNAGEDKKSFCNLVAEMSAPLNKLSGLSMLRKYGNKTGVNGDYLVKKVLEGDLYYHNSTLLDLNYCIGLSTYPLIIDGLKYSSLYSSPAKRPNSFTNQVIRFVQIASNHFAGATALTDYLQNYSYFTMLQSDYTDKERENDFQNLIHGVADEVRYASQCFDGQTKIIFKNKTGDIFRTEMRNLMHINDITKCKILTEKGFVNILGVKYSGQDFLYKFKLANNSILKVSPNHPCVMKDGIISANKVKIGDKMAVDFSSYSNEDKGDYELGRFIGLYASKGGSNDTGINFSLNINEEEYSKFIKNFANKHFMSCYISEISMEDEHCRRIYIYNKEVSAFVKSFVTGNVWNKRLQSKCFDSSTEFKKGLIDGYFDGNGNINKTNGTKQAYSTSLGLITDITDIMTSLGILTYTVIKNKKREYASLLCKGNRNTKKVGIITWLKPKSNMISKYFSDKKNNETYWIEVVDIEVSTKLHDLYDIAIDKEDQLFKLSNGIIVHNSPFVNVSINSPDTMRYSMGNYLWGGKYKINDLMDEVMRNQRIYAKFVSQGQLVNGKPIGLPYRFPITTLVSDSSFEKEYSEVWNEIVEDNANLCHLNIFNGWNSKLKSLSMCCRLSMDIKDMLNLPMNNTFGSFLQIGSHAVVSVNLPRLAYRCSNEEDFLNLLRHECECARHLLKLHREEIMMKRRIKYNYFFANKYLDMKKHFFSTIGFIGFANALEILGMKVTLPEGLSFGKRILEVMREESVRYSQEDGYMYNIEEVPAESASGTLAYKDKLQFNGKYDYYDSQFIPLSYDLDLFDRIEIEGELQNVCTGGAMSHLNLDGNPDRGALKDFTMKILKNSKIKQFAFNKGFTVCGHSHISQGINKVCPVCMTEDVPVDYVTRVVGYFTPLSAWNRAKLLEFKTRKWVTDKNIIT